MIAIQINSKFPLQLKVFLFAIVAFSFAPTAIAGRPMIVDDASIVADKNCQLESWRQKNFSNIEYWAAPACNFTGNLELALGAAAIIPDHMRSSKRIQMQGKTLFKTMETNGWGAGLVVGNQFDPNYNVIGDLYMRVPVSFSFQDDRFIVHTNVGWSRANDTKRNLVTWGIGSELLLSPKTALTAEVFGQNKAKPLFQFGLRHTLLPDRLQLSVSYGDRLSHRQADRFTSIGLILTSISIL